MNQTNVSIGYDAASYITRLCDRGGGRHLPLQILSSGITLVITVICCFHIKILKRFDHIKSTPYFFMLTLIPAADILTALQTAVKYSVPETLFVGHHIVWAALYTACLETMISFQCYVTLLTSIERHMAVCRPYQYGSSSFIKHIKKFPICLFMIGFCVSLLRMGLTADALCLSDSGRIKSLNKAVELAFNLIILFAIFASVTVMQLVIIYEINRMRKRELSEQEVILKDTSKYVVLATIRSFCYFAVQATFARASQYDGSNLLVSYTSCLFIAIMPFLNCMLFGYIHPAYRVKLREEIRRCGLTNVVRPT